LRAKWAILEPEAMIAGDLLTKLPEAIRAVKAGNS